MTPNPPTYNLTALVSAPVIPTEILWNLAYFFGALAFIYFVSTFFIRNKIASQTKKVKEKKKELAPIISEFLFYEENCDKGERINYLELKILIREHIKNDFDRKVLTGILMDLIKDVSGNTRELIYDIYRDLELHKDAFKKMGSWRWEVVAKGLFELTQMNVTDAFEHTTRYINNKHSTLRKQAEIAVVTLNENGISYFLDHTKCKISEWQQLKLLDVVRNKETLIPPSFRIWLTSKNNHVVLFALRLIKFYNQNDAGIPIIELVKHRNNHIKKEAIECIGDFNVTQAIPLLKTVFTKSTNSVKMAILGAIAQIGSEEDVDFLLSVELKEKDFTIKGKIISAINTLCPNLILPTHDIKEINISEIDAKESSTVDEVLEEATNEGVLETLMDLSHDITAVDHENSVLTNEIETQSNVPLEEEIETVPMVQNQEVMEEETLEISSELENQNHTEETVINALREKNLNDIEAFASKEKQAFSSLKSGMDAIQNPLDFQIPQSDFYDEAILEKMALLENIAELGDQREIPFLKNLLIDETSDVVIEKSLEIIAKLTTMENDPQKTKGQPNFEVTGYEVTDSVFNDLIKRGDLDSKVMLLKEIGKVGDEKELPLLHKLSKDNNTIIAKNAKKALAILNNRLIDNIDQKQKEIEAETKTIENIDSTITYNELFNLDFEPEKTIKKEEKITVGNSFIPGITLFNQICSATSKLYNNKDGQ
ncbi:HEAT repeat domain-containing protein [Maribacter sp. 2210JD10-5]|uniref:HEAT repeat domain-containing protein n=1 Tax=Maribacter sp. 2210JD10-5 TaxID=3386272 RepID=UPI0039BD777E